MKKIFLLLAIALIGLQSCDNKENIDTAAMDKMEFDVQHPSIATRATDAGFDALDQVGVFITESGANLDLIGNYKDNIALTYSGTAWNTAEPVYWNDGTYNVYGYYPYSADIASIDDYTFDVALDQSTAEDYSRSDFMWTCSEDVTASATNNTVALAFRHRMSRIVINLVKGEGFVGDLPEEADVYVHNTIPNATINLASGYPSTTKTGKAKTIKARKIATGQYAAIVVPQRIDNKRPLLEVVADGVSYMLDTRFAFKTGVQHNVNFTLSKNPAQVRIELGGEIDGWN